MSFGAAEAGDDNTSTFTPKKSNLSRLATERNAERKASSTQAPSYSTDYLAELKSATPTRPSKEATSGGQHSGEAEEEGDDVEHGDKEVRLVTHRAKDIDIASKFGPSALIKASEPSAIPSESEIREKKERRARLAKERNFHSLTGSDDDDETTINEDGRLVLREKEKYPESRLQRDDEDFAEGFDEFTEDGKIALGRAAEREAEKRRKREMIDMIAQAEGRSSEEDADEDDSEAERNAAYEAAQTRAGTYGERNTDRATDDQNRPRTPPRIAPVPDLAAVLGRLKASLQDMNEAKKAKVRRLEELAEEKRDLAEREVWIQQQLRDTGDRYEKLRLEAGMGAAGGGGANGIGSTTPEGRLFLDRGLESLGSGARGATPVGGLDADDTR
jgi:hypothetical protein